MILHKTEEALKKALQKKLIFEVNNKTLREGKLILFNIKDFYITFSIITSKNIPKTYELPVPYDIKSNSKGIIFDYTIKNITRGDGITEYLITTVRNKFCKKSKLFDNKLTIRFVD